MEKIEKRPDFNRHHPEMQPDEVFWSNVNDVMDDTIFMGERMGDEWYDIRWNTKRRGNTAYDIHGNVMKDSYPVFVKRQELQANGIDPDNLG